MAEANYSGKAPVRRPIIVCEISTSRQGVPDRGDIESCRGSCAGTIVNFEITGYTLVQWICAYFRTDNR
jgi:hypothetical protein